MTVSRSIVGRAAEVMRVVRLAELIGHRGVEVFVRRETAGIRVMRTLTRARRRPERLQDVRARRLGAGRKDAAHRRVGFHETGG